MINFTHQSHNLWKSLKTIRQPPCPASMFQIPSHQSHQTDKNIPPALGSRRPTCERLLNVLLWYLDTVLYVISHWWIEKQVDKYHNIEKINSPEVVHQNWARNPRYFLCTVLLINVIQNTTVHWLSKVIQYWVSCFRPIQWISPESRLLLLTDSTNIPQCLFLLKKSICPVCLLLLVD